MEYRADRFYIDQVLEGNINAFGHIIDRYKDRAFNLAYRICGNREEAEEVAQDSFLKSFRSLKEFRMQSSFTTWLYRIVYNTSITYLRNRKDSMLSLDDFPADTFTLAGNNYADEETEKEYNRYLVNYVLNKLNEEDRGLISMFYYDELSIAEISGITSVSKSNIKVRLHRIRQKMMDIINKVEKSKSISYEIPAGI